MSPKIIHFDIRPGKGKDIDLARMFPMTEAHPVRHRSVPFFVDDMRQKRMTPDFSLSKRIEITRFRTIPTLDLALREIVDPKPWQQKVLGLAPRPYKIDLVPPLDMPYGALDIRTRVYPKGDTYPDIFARRLPHSLMLARSIKSTRGYIRKHRRGIVGIVLTILCTTVPMLFFVRYSVESGYTKLLTLREVADITDARRVIMSARDDFERANFLFLPFSWLPIETVDMADRAIDGGRLLTRGLSTILSTLPREVSGEHAFRKSPSIAPQFRPEAVDIFPLEHIGITLPTDWIDRERDVIARAFADMVRAGEIYSGVHSDTDIGHKMHDVGAILARGMRYLEYSIAHKDELLQFLGHTEPIRYLVFNQNRDEIRANGGFPGSVIVFTLYKGNILDMRRDDVYYYDWNLYPYKEPPPPGLALLTDNYGLRDVNYYPDFRITLDKANRFIERSGDSTITSAVAIHQGIIEDILQKTGPVTVSGVTIPFDSENFSLLMSTLVEYQYGREYHPKEILFHFGESLISRIHEKRLYESVLDILERHWQDGEILFASRDAAMDNIIARFRRELPWECVQNSKFKIQNNEVSGENFSASQSGIHNLESGICGANWIYPVFTSVSGNKSDRYIVRKYQGSTQRLNACTYENKVTLALSHTYSQQDRDLVRSYMDTLGITDKAEREKLEFIEGGGKNRAFTRLYVPKSAVIAFTGADMTITENEYAKVYSFVLETSPGATTSKTLRYTVDIGECSSVDTDLTWTRQPGIRELIITPHES